MSKQILQRMYRLKPDKTLFMLCDVQEKFRPAIPIIDAVIENTMKLTNAGKILNVPLVVTEQYPEKLGKTVEELDLSHACCILPKTQFSMLVPEMKEFMKQLYGDKPKTAVLFGIETHVCVEQTAFDLINNNIDVWLVADCVASRNNQDRDLALERLRHIGVTIVSSESVIFNLLGDKKHESFKQIASLVKKQSADVKLSQPTTKNNK